MWQILSNLKIVWDNYPIEFAVFILSVTYNICRVLNDLLPTKYKLNKRFSFLNNVKSTLFIVTVSIPCSSLIKPAELLPKFKSLWTENTRVVKQENGLVVFKSLATGASYTVQLAEGDDKNKSLITIERLNGFKINRFGIIRDFNSSIEELQEMVNIFSGEKESTEKVITQIRITLNKRVETKKKEEVQKKLECESRKFFFSCSLNHIKVVNYGIPNIKNSIYTAFFNWIEEYI